MAKLITITLDQETAEFSVDLTGFQGVGCEAIEKAFAELGTTTKSVRKPEYSQKNTNVVRK